jgi:PAS domain S-box-containing protein
MSAETTILLIARRDSAAVGHAECLRSHGFDLRIAEDAESAAEALQQDSRIELLLLDISSESPAEAPGAVEELLQGEELPLVLMIGRDAGEALRRVKNLPRYGAVRADDEELLTETAAGALRLHRQHRSTFIDKETYRLIYDTEDDAVLMIDEAANSILEANRSAERIYGYGREELIGMKVWKLSADPDATKEAIGKMIPEQRFTAKREHRRKDGSVFPVQVTATRTRRSGKPINVATIRDITEQKVMERELREREREYEEVVDTVPSAIIKYANDQRITFFSRYAEKIFGYTEEEVLGKLATETTNPLTDSSGHDHAEMFDRLLAEPEQHSYHENENIRKDGTRIWMSWRNASLYDSEGNRIGMLSIGNDITDYKRSREQLEASRVRYRTIFNEAPMGIVTTDKDGTILSANPFFCRWIGYSQEELSRMSPEDFTHPEDFSRENERMQRMLRDETDVVRMEKRYLRRDGGVVWGDLLTKAVHWEDEEQAYIVALVMDITKRKESEADRLRLLEEKELLLREVHHRIKNDMHVISSLLALQASESKTPNEAEALEEAENRIRLMRGIYDKLYLGQDFRSMEIGPFLNDLLGELKQSYDLGLDIAVSTEISECEIPVKLSFPLGLIINELVTNAFKYAFPGKEKGGIHVRVGSDRLDEAPCIEAVVRDDGIGLPEQVASKQRLGFGLTIVDAMVRQYGGSWDIENETGSLHRIALPIPDTASSVSS